MVHCVLICYNSNDFLFRSNLWNPIQECNNLSGEDKHYIGLIAPREEKYVLVYK